MLSSLMSAIVGFFTAYIIIYLRDNIQKWPITWSSQSSSPFQIPLFHLQSQSSASFSSSSNSLSEEMNLGEIDQNQDSIMNEKLNNTMNIQSLIISIPIPMSIIKYPYHPIKRNSISSIMELMTGNWFILIHQSKNQNKKKLKMGNDKKIKKKLNIQTDEIINETIETNGNVNDEYNSLKLMSLDRLWNIMIITNNDDNFVEIGSLLKIKYYPSMFQIRNGRYKQMEDTRDSSRNIKKQLTMIDNEEEIQTTRIKRENKNENQENGWIKMERGTRWMFKWQLYILKHYLNFLIFLIK